MLSKSTSSGLHHLEYIQDTGQDWSKIHQGIFEVNGEPAVWVILLHSCFVYLLTCTSFMKIAVTAWDMFVRKWRLSSGIFMQ